jgi:hypothetical protein
MATKLQKYELQKLLEKYGGVIRTKDDDNWKRITLAPYGRGANTRYSSSRKVEYIAMRQVRLHLFHDLMFQVRVIEDES